MALQAMEEGFALKESFIKSSPLFAELSEAEQRAIGKRMRLENYQPNEALFVQGGESDALYLIKEGWVKITATDGGPSVANLGPGSLIGEADFFLGRPRTTTARPSGTLTVWSLTNEDLSTIISERPETGLNLGLAFGNGIVQYQDILTQQLTEVPLLKDLSQRERILIAERLSPQRYNSNEAIYRSGDLPTGLYFIEKGTVRLMGDSDEDYAEVMRGDVFGEMSVISAKPHSNTAQAAIETIVWQLSPADFTSLTDNYPSIKSSLSRNLRASLSQADQAYAITVLKQISLFADLPQAALEDVARLILLRHVPAGELVFNQGDAGDALYIVDSGLIEAIADSPGQARELIGRFSDGDYFGEITLLTGKTRSYTAFAANAANLWGLYRTDFDSLLLKYPQLGTALSNTVRERLDASSSKINEPHLSKLVQQAGLSRMEVGALAERLQPRRYQAGSAVFHEGQIGYEMYFIGRGQIELWASTMQGPRLLETLGTGDFFGEIALLSGRNYPATAHVFLEAEIWALTKPDFDDFVRRYPHLAMPLSRLFSDRLDHLFAQLHGGAPQRALPPATGPGANPTDLWARATALSRCWSTPTRSAYGPNPIGDTNLSGDAPGPVASGWKYFKLTTGSSPTTTSLSVGPCWATRLRRAYAPFPTNNGDAAGWTTITSDSLGPFPTYYGNATRGLASAASTRNTFATYPRGSPGSAGAESGSSPARGSDPPSPARRSEAKTTQTEAQKGNSPSTTGQSACWSFGGLWTHAASG